MLSLGYSASGVAGSAMTDSRDSRRRAQRNVLYRGILTRCAVPLESLVAGHLWKMGQPVPPRRDFTNMPGPGRRDAPPECRCVSMAGPGFLEEEEVMNVKRYDFGQLSKRNCAECTTTITTTDRELYVLAADYDALKASLVKAQREAYISGTLRDRGVMSEDWMECIREEAEMIYADVKEATHA